MQLYRQRVQPEGLQHHQTLRQLQRALGLRVSLDVAVQISAREHHSQTGHRRRMNIRGVDAAPDVRPSRHRSS